MADITMCNNSDCHMADSCWRHCCPPEKVAQSYARFEPDADLHCGMHMPFPMDGESQEALLKRLMNSSAVNPYVPLAAQPPTPAQAKTIRIIAAVVRSWGNTNDLSSPTHHSDFYEAIGGLESEGIITREQYNSIIVALSGALNAIRAIK